MRDLEPVARRWSVEVSAPREIAVSAERRAFFTMRTLAEYLAISPRTVRDMLARGVIPSYRIEGSRRIDPADVDVYLAARKDTSTRAAA